MKAPRLDHIGVIVPDLDLAMQQMSVLFPDGPSSLHEMPEVGLRIAKFAAENISLELLQYSAGDSEIARETMGSRPGLNHIAVAVDDLDVAIIKFTTAGFHLQAGFPRIGAHGRIAFFKVHKATGLRLELVCR